MKKIFLVLGLFFFSCNEIIIDKPVPENPDALLSIQVDSHFDNDLVYLEMDKIPLLNESVTTNYTVSLAWSKNQLLTSGNHTINFKMPNIGKEKSYTFNLQDTLSLLIYFRDSIYFQEYRGYLLRD